jgi:FixJ family two-component response regulator
LTTPEGVLPEKSLISVVDDDEAFLDSLRRLMRALGHTVQTFLSAADFLASPRLADTACLIADVHMPGMNGDELHRRLIDSGCAIPTILVTAYRDDVVRGRALKDGVVCCLSKPLDEKHFADCLRLALERSKRAEGS